MRECHPLPSPRIEPIIGNALSETVASFPELNTAFADEPHPFERWLESEIGSDVFHRIMNNRHAVPMDKSAAYFDTAQDVQQKALIWLWERWECDPRYEKLTRYATEPSHAAGIITKTAMLRARCLYAKRRREGRERQTDLFFSDGNERFIPYHDRPVSHCDKRTDIQNAIEKVVQRMIADQTHYRTGIHGKGQLNQRYATIPIEHITRTIIEGYMYHYTDRYSQTGTFRKFCEARGVSKNQIARWRPQIMVYLQEELKAYAPLPLVKPPLDIPNSPSKNGMVSETRLPIPDLSPEHQIMPHLPREVIVYLAPQPPGLYAAHYRFSPLNKEAQATSHT